jgi:hypothetical protein
MLVLWFSSGVKSISFVPYTDSDGNSIVKCTFAGLLKIN